MWIYSKYYTNKNGIRIYPKSANCFRFWVDDDKFQGNLNNNVASNPTDKENVPQKANT